MENKIHTPDPLDTWENKKKDAYGLSYAKLISKEWFNGGPVTTKDCQYQSRKQWIVNKRLMARGEQDTQRYKEHMSRQEGDMDYMNLDVKPINNTGKFCNVVSNGISDEYYTLDIRANDRLTLQRKKDKMAEHRRNMRSMPLLRKTKEILGLDLLPTGFVPQDEEELQLYSEIKDRPKIEIAEEIVIDYIKKTNDYKFLETQKNKDLVQIGICASRTWTDPVNGVRFEYMDPEYLVHSYVKKNNFKDAYYFGALDTITLDDVKRESGFDDKTMREIAKAYTSTNNTTINYETCDMSEVLSLKVEIMRFTFKTSKTEVYKQIKRKGKSVKVSKRDENFDPPERSDYGKLVDVKDTWMEGTYIVNSDYVYNYQECEHIIRDERNNPVCPFTVRATNIYKNKLHSFLDDMEVIDDQLQYINLKTQHLVAELKPDLTVINEDALADLEGEGDKTKILEETLKILHVKGVVIEKAVDMGEMGMQNKQGARPSSHQQGSAIVVLLNAWNHYYNQLRETTGINPARDGSLPADALLGVNQMAQLASNTVTKHIVDASIEFNKDLSEVISSRVHNIFRSKQEGAQRLKKMYERAVGKQNMDALESMKDRHLHDFGFTVEMVPTKQEMQEFKEDLAISLQEGLIDVEVKSEAQRIAKTNMKLASQYLFYMRKKKRKELMEEKTRESQVKSQNDIKSAQAASQSQVQAYGMKTQMDLEAEAKRAEIEVMKAQAMKQIEAPEKEREFRQEVFLKQLDNAKEFNMKKYMEDRKDDRTKIQATQQSKMVEQRKSDNPTPIDFETPDFFENIFNVN